MKISGIYKIVNKINGHYYVGSSKDISKRWVQHRHGLKTKTHHNLHLINAWYKYGEENFDFVIIKEIAEDKLYEVEQKYLDECSKNPDIAYNLNYSPDGGRPSEESIEKIREKLKGRKFTEEHRRKMSIANRGRFYSQETRDKIGKYSSTRIHSQETRNKISTSLRGQKRSTETRAKQSASLKGKNGKPGNKNPRFDSIIRLFVNESINECFLGTRFDFIRKYQISDSMASSLIKNKRKLAKGWHVEVVYA